MREIIAFGSLLIVAGSFAGAFYLAASGSPIEDVVLLLTPDLILIRPVLRYYFPSWEKDKSPRGKAR
jgi:hypothetical protein